MNNVTTVPSDKLKEMQARIAELEQQLAESENLRIGIEAGMDCANAEAKRVRGHNFALLAAIEQSVQPTYNALMALGPCDCAKTGGSCFNCELDSAYSVLRKAMEKPSADLLAKRDKQVITDFLERSGQGVTNEASREERDKERDAALLRGVANKFLDPSVSNWIHKAAAARLDGSWVPELEPSNAAVTGGESEA